LEADVERIANGLAAWGVPKGARLALLVKPGIEFVTLVFALLRAGMVVVLVDPGLGRRNLIRCLSETEPEGFVAIGRAQAVRLLLRNQFPQGRWNVTIGRRWFWGGKTLSELREMGDAVTSGNNEKLPTITHADDTAAIIFTSGSTGPPKGVLYTHRMFDTQVEEIQSTYGIKAGGVDLACFPLFALFNVAMGVTTVLPQMNFSRPASADPKKLLTAAKDWNVSQAFASPAVWRLLSNHCARTEQQIETLRQVFSCGAPVPADVLSDTLACVGKDAKMHTPYGATECLPISTIEAAEVLGETTALTAQGAGICVGRKFDSIDWRVIRITDEPIARIDEAVELPLGEIGELVVRGPQVSPRYVTRIEANAESKIADQNTIWHRTGDVGYFDEQSRFWYCGRKSQRVETAAGPLFTECVEGVFNRHPDVEISALVGLGRAGDQLPVIAVKFRPAVRVGRYSGAGAFADFTRLAATVFPAPIICDWMEFEEMPVDVRHNSKINREILREGVSIGILAEPNLFHPEFVARARQAS
jgi:acyl-CoA synthetase (AMP-forming)/AMP-acid ligase II